MQQSLEYLNSSAKRFHDIASASLFMPALAMLWLPLRKQAKLYSDNGGPYLMRQERIGKDSRPFDVLKFRTIFESTVELMPDAKPHVIDERSDKTGNIIRMLGLDETSQLINVLRGDMSFVGPRPFLSADIETFVNDSKDKVLAEEWREVRSLTKPGIIGPGQFYVHRKQSAYDPHGREIQMKEDIRYVETASFMGDVALIGSIPKEMFKLGSLALHAHNKVTT